MTITFPRPLPAIGDVSQRFELERVDYDAPETGGQTGSISAGFPRWTMTLTFGDLDFDEAAELGAWIDAQRGGQRTFLAHDRTRNRPAFYQDGRPFQPTPASWSQTINADGLALLTLAGLNPGQVVSTRDYIGFAFGDNRALVRSLQLAVADAAGTVTFPIEPPVPPVVPVDAATTLQEASCLMKLIPGESRITDAGLGYHDAGSLIVARQTVLP